MDEHCRSAAADGRGVVMQELIKKWRRLARSNRRVHKKAIKCGGSDIPALTQAATLEACVKELQELESTNDRLHGRGRSDSE